MIYTTRSGDTWDSIAFAQMGGERYMDLLIAANPDHGFIIRFDSGVVLTVPAIPTPARPSTLPPWRR